MGMMMLLGQAMMAVCALGFCSIIAGLVFHRIIGDYIEGNIGGIECVTLAGLCLGFLLTILTGPTSPVHLLLAFLMLAGVFASLLFSHHMGKRSTKGFYDERVEQFKAQIGSDPRNIAARERLADTLRRLGRLEEAVTVYEELLVMAPNSREEAYKLRLIREEIANKKSSPQRCPGCGHQNPAGRTTCESCEGDLRILSRMKRWLLLGGTKRLVISYAISIGAVAVVGGIFSLVEAQFRFVLVLLVLLIFLISQLVIWYMRW